MEHRVVTGQLIHEDKQQQPLYGLSVELWDRDLIVGDILGTGVTDSSGRFRIEYNPADAGRLERNMPDLELQVFDRQREPSDNKTDRLLAKVQGPNSSQSDLFNFGQVRIPHWEYDLSYPFPVVLKSSYTHKLPQCFAKGYTAYLIRQNAQLVAKSAALTALAKAGNGRQPALKTIQRSYPETLSQKLQPTEANSDDFFVYRIVNGFNPSMLCEEPGAAGTYSVNIDWDASESDGTHDLWNAKLTLQLRADNLTPSRLQLIKRKTGRTQPSPADAEILNVVPGDPDWDSAKRIFRSTWLVAGEHDSHLSAGHLNVGQYAIAGFRNFEQSPLTRLLFPHLRGVVKINDLGKTAIFGTTGVLTTNSPLTTGAAWSRLASHLGTLDWKDWKPREHLYAGHTYAKAANIFWNVVQGHVQAFFDAHETDIAKYWYEAKRFSDDVVAHSVAYSSNSTYATWYDKNEGDNSDQGRVKKRGKLRAVRPITETSSSPSANDMANLQQLCRYVIFHATFFHTWANDLQLTDMGHVAFTSLALRNGSIADEGNNDSFNDSVGEESILPPPLESIEQLKFAHILATSKRGTLLGNEDNDVPADFMARLEACRAEFALLKNPFELDSTFDVASIRSRINI